MIYAVLGDDDRIAKIMAGDPTGVPGALPLPPDFTGVVGMHRLEFNDNWTVKPLSERVAAGYYQLPPGYKLDGEAIVQLTREERYRDGLDPIPEGVILDGGTLRPMTRAEMVAAGTLTQAEADALDKQDRIAEIKSRLGVIDTLSARPLRAVIAGTATDMDRQKLSDLETEAQTLRAELTALEAQA